MKQTSRTCSICNEMGHNKKTCPKKEIDDISNRNITEVDISEVEQTMINEFMKAQSFGIKPQIIMHWLQCKRTGGSNTIGKIKVCMDDGLNDDYIKLFINCLDAIDEYY